MRARTRARSPSGDADTSRKTKKPRKGPWEEDEEAALQKFVDDFGTKWSKTELARYLPDRTPDACNKHWQVMVARGDATRSNPAPEIRLNTTIEAVRKELVRRRRAFSGMLTPEREGVLEALGLVEERAKAALKVYRSLQAMRAALGQLKRARRPSQTRVVEAAADVETAFKAWDLSRGALYRAKLDAEAVSDKYDLDWAKEVAGDNPTQPELAAIAALERKAEESRAATRAAAHARLRSAANQVAATARA